MASVSPLAEAYIEALQGRAIYVHEGLRVGTDGRLRARAAHIGFAPFRKKGLVAAFWFRKPAHAELVAQRCVKDFRAADAMRSGGWVDLPPLQVVESIKATAAMVGAAWQTQAEVERDAEGVVAAIMQRVKDARMDGELKAVNARYKLYRLAQTEKSEPAIPYAAFMLEFVRSLVIAAAKKSMQAR